MSLIISMATFALVASITPGPVNIVALSSGAQFGFRASQRHVAGATLGFVVLLVLMGLVPLEKLTRIRGYVLIAVFVIAAILTPPDAISQTVMAVPMYLLYEGGILFARVVTRARARQENSQGEGT